MEAKYLALLEEMVNIDSGTGDAEGLARVGAIIRREAAHLGYDFQKITGSDGTEHYYVHQGQGKRILLIAHLDTVFPKGTVAVRPYTREGDIARGPGVSDCKSGVVTILAALERLGRGGDTMTEIGCLFNCDEEVGSPGSRGIIETLARDAQAVLVVEPAEEETITVARKGIGRFKLEVFGKAAHSGASFEEGRSAILELAHKILLIHGLTDLSAGITLNTGVIHGGTKSNVIPEYAMADIDLRIVALGQEQDIIKRMKEITATHHIEGVTAKLSGGITRPPMPRTSQNMDLFSLFQKTAAGMGLELGSSESGGGSDANFVAALGVPVVDGIGPIGGGHHADEEYLNLPSLFQRIELLTTCLKILIES